MTTFKKAALLLTSALLILSAASCTKNDPAETTPDTNIAETAAPKETNVNTPETTPPETEVETLPTETDAETVPLLPNDAELVNPDETLPPETTPPASETGTPETSAPDERIYDYLNGKTVTKEEQNRRPVAIMLNNIQLCLPQNNLNAGDIYYEFPVEGQITRIMMLVSDYQQLGVVGSIRSARDYYVDMLHTHNAIYLHAGGSPMSYDAITAQNVDNLDGVTYIPEMYYRDEERLYNMGLEHSLMTTGAGIQKGLEYMEIETNHSEDFVPTFKFYDETVDYQPVGAIASHVHMISTYLQTVDFVYNKDTGEYLRYQYNGMPHVDGITNEQLSVKNVIILFTDTSLIPGDDAGRLDIRTVGNGQGYYITNGRRKVITWSKESETAPLVLKYKDNGEEVILNCGKTFICVVDKGFANDIVFDYQW